MARFEDFMTSSSSAGTTKTASAPIMGSDFLSKIASELGVATGVPGQPVIGQQVNAGASTVAAPAPEVVAAMAGMMDGQQQMAGGDVAAQTAGSNPSVGMVDPVRVSDMTGVIDDDLAIVNSVTNGKPVEGEKVASLLDACSQGRAMARAFIDEQEKVAFAQAYDQSVELLKEAGLLGYYAPNYEMDKVASAPAYSCLEKLANNEDLSYSDVVGAAQEFLMYKQAEAEADAHADMIADQIIADASGEVNSEVDAAADAAAAAADAMSAGSSATESAAHAAAAAVGEKTASAMDLSDAIAVLKAAGRI